MGLEEVLIQAIEESYEEEKIPTKIKMKESSYNALATECHKLFTYTEILDKFHNPLNTFYGLRVEIDNSIDGDFKII
jgi:hypothetical protein